MFFHHHDKMNFKEKISQTIFLTSLFSFIVFLSLDLLFPGFVLRTFSVYWFLLATIVGSVWWSVERKPVDKREKRFWPWFLVFFSSVALGLTVWNWRADFDEWLFLVFPLALIAPFLVLWLVREN